MIQPEKTITSTSLAQHDMTRPTLPDCCKSFLTAGLRSPGRSVGICVLLVSIVDVKVPHLIGALVGRHYPQEVAEILRLQIFLAQVLQVTLGERGLAVQIRSGKSV